MSFPEQPFGFVAGRWVRSIGDTPDDADRAPDYVPVETGTVVFTPQVTHRVASDGTGWAGIIKERIPARLGERGQLIDAEGHDHLALAVGVYSVSYEFGSGRSWPSHYIEVKTTHTVDSPLWLPPIAPPPEGPMIENRVVTIPADGADGQVLVWDGAGFSWMDAPEGPQGPPGEVTTAALTTALVGKVSGTGMSVRVDTTVGTRVFLDHPGGTTMIHGDTGWRRLYAWDSTGTITIGGEFPAGITPIPEVAGWIDIRRTTDLTHIAFHRVRVVGSAVIPLPAGFRARTQGTKFETPRGIISIAASVFMTAGDWGLSGAAGLYADEFAFPPANAIWPATLPGVPA